MSKRVIFAAPGGAADINALKAALGSLDRADVTFFDSITAMRRQMRSEVPELLIGPWADGGVTLLGARSTLARPNDDTVHLPFILALTDEVTPAKIALAQGAGAAELIPSQPFDPLALRNRVLLLLDGASALASSLHADGEAFESVLENLPALKRRLAA